jgi:hypothetical protein
MAPRFGAAAALFVSLAVGLLPVCGTARTNDPSLSGAVDAVATRRFTIVAAARDGVLRYSGTGSLDEPDRDVVRALIVVHGALRNAVSYERSTERAVGLASAGDSTIVIAPQFLSEVDVDAHALPASTLRWRKNDWDGGAAATSPVPLSSFAVLDAIVTRLADRTRYPKLREIVVVGFSAGGQTVQRYAVVASGWQRAIPSGTHVRFVVSDPSSYLYFDTKRPLAGGGFGPFDAAACPSFDRWKYGPEDPPPYVAAPVTSYEAAYAERDVTYLVGTADDDPQQAALDRSCAGEAQGPNRVARSRAYVSYISQRHPAGTNQTFAESLGVAHDVGAMFASPCGVAVLFGLPRTVCERSGKV